MCIRIPIDYITFYIISSFPADSVHLKKPSVGPEGLLGPPCHGAHAMGPMAWGICILLEKSIQFF